MSRELTIPRKRGETNFARLRTLFALVFTILAICGVCFRVVPIVSFIWLLFVMILLWQHGKGGLRALLVDWLGAVAGRQFVRATTADPETQELTFGFQLLGHRFVQLQILAEQISSVEWNSIPVATSTSQVWDDWTVWLRFDHANPASSENTSAVPETEQGIWILGATILSKETESFSVSFVRFLVEAGANLVPGDRPQRLVRDG